MVKSANKKAANGHGGRRPGAGRPYKPAAIVIDPDTPPEEQVTPADRKGPGGKREGAGRPPGSKNKRTLVLTELQQRISKSGRSPLEWLLDRMDDEGLPMWFRKECAVEALPFCHPKLALVRVEGDDDGSKKPETDEEISRIEWVIRPQQKVTDAVIEEVTGGDAPNTDAPRLRAVT